MNPFKNTFGFVLFILTTGIVFNLNAQSKTEIFPSWKEGEMDIHHINTGRGECVFCIFPDGTNMLIDAGDFGSQTEAVHTDASPDDSKQAGEWIARYISRLLKNHSPRATHHIISMRVL